MKRQISRAHSLFCMKLRECFHVQKFYSFQFHSWILNMMSEPAVNFLISIHSHAAPKTSDSDITTDVHANIPCLNINLPFIFTSTRSFLSHQHDTVFLLNHKMCPLKNKLLFSRKNEKYNNSNGNSHTQERITERHKRKV